MSIPPFNTNPAFMTLMTGASRAGTAGASLPDDGFEKGLLYTLWGLNALLISGLTAIVIDANFINPREELTETFKAQAVQVVAKKGDKKVQMNFPALPLRVEKDSKGADITYTKQPYATGWFAQNQFCTGTYQHQRYYQHTGKYKGWKVSTTEPVARVCTPMYEAVKDPAKQEMITAMRGAYAKLWPSAKLTP